MRPLSRLDGHRPLRQRARALLLVDTGRLGREGGRRGAPGGRSLRHSPGMWASLNRGKQSLVLDLKSTEGRDVLAALARRADIVLEGWRPGVASRLGADCETLRALNPALVYCSISGFGQDGPWRDRPAHDLNYLALSGYLGVQAAMDGAPTPPPVSFRTSSPGFTPPSRCWLRWQAGPPPARAPTSTCR